MGVQRPRTRKQASSSSAPFGTQVHAMADSERLSAPGCWAACTNFSRTRKGFVLLAEIVSVLGLAGGQRRVEWLDHADWGSPGGGRLAAAGDRQWGAGWVGR